MLGVIKLSCTSNALGAFRVHRLPYLTYTHIRTLHILNKHSVYHLHVHYVKYPYSRNTVFR